jgi:hygromycin-B 4-O-kinase
MRIGDVMPTDSAVRDFLSGHFRRPISELARIALGEWSQAYSFRCNGDDYIARFSALEEDFAKDRLVAAYATADLPIPPIVAMGRAFDGFYAISRRAFGEFIDDLDAAHMRAVLPALFAALDAARLTDLSATAGFGGWGAGGDAPHASWRAYLLDVTHDRPTDRVSGWRQRLDASPERSGPFDAAAQRLQTLVDACPEERHLIHSDLLHFNVLIDGNRLSAVFDWGCSLYGDFLYDVAWLTFWAPWYRAWDGIDFREEAARHYAAIGLEVPDMKERLRCYELHIGLGSLAYSAYKEYWEHFAWTAERTLRVAMVG